MASGESAFDGLLCAATVKGSQVSENGVVLFNLEVFQGGEASTGDAVFGSLGDGGRPLPPDDDGFAEVIAVRASDSLPVAAARDLRIEKGRQAPPAEGTVYRAGYYGAELRFDVVNGQQRSTAALIDGAGTSVALTQDGGVVVLGAGLTQGAPGSSQDMLLAQTAIDLLAQIGPAMLVAMGAIKTLVPGSYTPTQIAQLTAALAPFLVPAAGPTPAAPTTRAPKLRGTPGA